MRDASRDGKSVPLGNIGFDPFLVVTQICLLQALHYLSVGAVMVAVYGLATLQAPTLGMIFDPSLLDLTTSEGLAIAVSQLASAVLGAYYLLHVVGRSKKCLDFAVTLYVFHTIAAALFSSFPTNGVWWMLTLADLCAMTLVSEYLCMKRELREIAIQV